MNGPSGPGLEHTAEAFAEGLLETWPKLAGGGGRFSISKAHDLSCETCRPCVRIYQGRLPTPS